MSPHLGLHRLMALRKNEFETRNGLFSDSIRRRTKSSNMVAAENELLFQMVARNFREFNTKVLVGKKIGKSSRQRLLEHWAAQVTALGFSSRSPEQIHEKVRKAVEKCRKSIAFEKSSSARGMSAPHHIGIPYYLEPLKQVLLCEAEEALSGAPAILTLEDDDDYCDSKESVQDVLRSMTEQRCESTPPRDSHSFTLSNSSLPTTDAPSRITAETEDGPRYTVGSLFDDGPSTSSRSYFDGEECFDSKLKLALLEAELKAVEMKKEYYAKKMRLAEAQIELTTLQIEQYRIINNRFGPQKMT